MENVKHIVDKANSNVCHTSSVLYVDTKISSEHLKELKKLTKNIIDNPDQFQSYNDHLAGNLEKEYVLNESHKILKPYLNFLVKLYRKQIEEHKDCSLKFSDSWVNLQKKHEFNPFHDHTGDYSYVLWIQIPYDLKKEFSLPNCVNANTQNNSVFSFSYLNFLGKIVEKRLLVDKSWEGTIILFPSNLNHQVYPFYTSDDYRISISGNIKIMPHQKNTFDYG